MANLVDALTAPGARRRFHVPLASIPPGRDAVRTVDPSTYTFSEQRLTVPGPPPTTAEIRLTIGITPTAGVFTDEDDLPDPAMRLHAVDAGMVFFEAAGDTHRLVLRTFTFAQPLHLPEGGGVRWWERWIEAGCLPAQVIYDNVDRDAFAARLADLPAPPPDSVLPPASHYGLSFPRKVTSANKDSYIAELLDGVPNRPLFAEPGAYLGIAAEAPVPAGSRVVYLAARYQDHTEAAPQPMNVRELFNLLFGDDSAEARNHPLLTRMNHHAEHVQQLLPETRRMFLRPPLRTSFRVEWEAALEARLHNPEWKAAGSLGVDRFFNTVERDGRRFDPDPFTKNYKCNLFVCDMLVRSGFCTGVHPVSGATPTAPQVWHYRDANAHANLVHRERAVQGDRIPLMCQAADRKENWGWKIENWLRAPGADITQRVDAAIRDEGRCFVLAAARPRQFKEKKLPGGAVGISDCANDLKLGIGHIVLVRGIAGPGPAGGQPYGLAATVGDGFQHIGVRTYEAMGTNGAGTRVFHPSTSGAGSTPDATAGFIWIHLFEIRAGRDPGTAQGLRDLNRLSPNLLAANPADPTMTKRERAPRTPKGFLPNGTPIPPGRCCTDPHPPPWPAVGVEGACP